MSTTTLRKLRSVLSGSSTPNPAAVLESVFQAMEEDFDIFVVFQAGEALSENECVDFTLSSLTGSIDIDDGTSSLVGTGAAFTTELQIGDTISLSGRLFTIESIADDDTATTLELNTTGSTISDASPQVVTVTLSERGDDGTFTKCIGCVVSDTASGALARVRTYGLATGFSGLTPGEPYIVDDTAGAIVRLSTEAWSDNYQVVGFALSDTVLFVCPSAPVLASVSGSGSAGAGFATLAALKALTSVKHLDSFTLYGEDAYGDIPNREYYYDSTSSETADDLNYIALDSFPGRAIIKI